MKNWRWKSLSNNLAKRVWHQKLSSEFVIPRTKNQSPSINLEMLWKHLRFRWAEVNLKEWNWFSMKIWKVILHFKNSKMLLSLTTNLERIMSHQMDPQFTHLSNTDVFSNFWRFLKREISLKTNSIEVATPTIMEKSILKSWNKFFPDLHQSFTKKICKLSWTSLILIVMENQAKRNSWIN